MTIKDILDKYDGADKKRFSDHDVTSDWSPLPDEENTKFFQDKMNEQFGWNVDVDAD